MEEWLQCAVMSRNYERAEDLAGLRVALVIWLSAVFAGYDAAVRVEGVRDVKVQERWMGRSLVQDIEGRLSPDDSLKAAEEIGSRVTSAVFDAVPAARRLNWIPRGNDDESIGAG